MKFEDIRHNGFTEDLGTDWVAVDPATRRPIARASDRESVEQAAPGAEYFQAPGSGRPAGSTARKAAPEEIAQIAEPPETEPPKPVDVVEPEQSEQPADDKPDPLDHDGDGRRGGSESGENATASKSRRKRKPAD